MKVSDFQKYLRALADAISAKAPARELTDAANALTPFAHHKMEEFAAFLKLAEQKYSETGELPDGNPPKVTRTKMPKAPAAPKLPPPTVDELVAAVDSLKVRLRTDSTLGADGVVAELKGFDVMSKDNIILAVERLGMKTKPGSKAKAMAMIVNHTIAAQSGFERSDA